MSNLSQLRKAFRDVDAEDTGSIDRKQLSKVLSLAGLELTRAEFLEILEAVVNDEEKVDYKEFIQFFKSKMVSGSNSKYNRLIMKSVTGKAKTSSYDLPGKYHTYGIKNAKNDEPAKDVILTWVPFKSERTDNKKLNIVKMNKAAIKSKHVGVRDLMDYNREHPIYEKPGVSSSPTRTKSTKEMLGGSRSLPGGKAFGRVNEKDEPIYKLVNGEYVVVVVVVIVFSLHSLIHTSHTHTLSGM